jgi:hypothetical protein
LGGRGRSAHAVLLADQEPELMLKMAQHFCLSIDEVIARLAALSK